MKIARRLALTVVIAALLTAVAYGSGWATLPTDDPIRTDAPTKVADTRVDEPKDTARPPRQTPPRDVSPEKEEEPERPELTPGPALLSPGDEGANVKDLQARLKQIDWFAADVTGFYGEVTTEAVRGFQAKREIPVTGEVDQRTLDRLNAMTREPTRNELLNIVPKPAENGSLDPRCMTGRVLCIDKSTNSLRWVIDGTTQMRVDVRFGSDELPTREGQFSVNYKSRDHVSSLYNTSMPYAMFFSGGQAVHYSPDFAANGYNGASHGCVNVRDYGAVQSLFNQVNVGDKVIVYWS